MATVTVLFNEETRQQIISACAKRKIALPEDFDTKGMMFETALIVRPEHTEYIDGFLGVSTASLEDSSKEVIYYYPLGDIARIKVED